MVKVFKNRPFARFADREDIGLVPELHKSRNKSCISLREMRFYKEVVPKLKFRNNSIEDKVLAETVKRLEADQADANLGGGVYKVRVARPGEGKSGGYRVLVVFKSELMAVYIYGFAKSDRDDINPKELKNLKRAAKIYFSMTPIQLAERIGRGQLVEIDI